MDEVLGSIRFFVALNSVNYGILIFLLVLVLLSGFFSACETAISAMNKVRIKLLAEDGNKKAQKLIHLSERYDKTISAILIGSNMLNISIATIAVGFFISLFRETVPMVTIEIISLSITTLVVLMIGEFLPKALAKEHPDFIALKIANVLYLIVIIMTPLTWIFMPLKNLLGKNKNKNEGEIPANEDELEAILDSMEEKGILESEENELIQCVLTLNDKTVSDIMVPRVDMTAISVKEEIETVKKLFFEEKYSRIPVYSEDKDNVIGVLYERDFFTKLLKGQKIILRNVMREVHHVPKTMKVDALIQLLRKNKSHMAIVTDEFGGTDGLVTMEDALEEIVGEIYDEHDELEVTNFQKISDNEYLLDADLEVDELFEKLKLDAPESHQFQKLTGWLLELSESFPEAGTKINYQVADNHFDEEKNDYISVTKDLEFEILEITERRIMCCRLVVSDVETEKN